MEIKVNGSCTGCGICRNVCMYDAIKITGGKAVIDESCIFCGACIEVCKFKSIMIVGLDEVKEKDFSGYSGVCVFLETRTII